MTKRLPLLSVVIPTIGRATLARTLDSVLGQGDLSDVEVVVVGDALGGPVPLAGDMTRRRGFRYFEHAGRIHCWGHPQRQAGMAAAKGRWLLFGADDNIWTEGAFDRIREAIDGGGEHPHLFRVRAVGRQIVWSDRIVRMGNIDADCIVTPNDPDRTGIWGSRYEGDYDFVLSTVRLHGDVVTWNNAVISLARPREDECWAEQQHG